MAFVERVMRFTFSGARSGSFSASGLMASASIQTYPQRAGTTAQVKIWGLTLDQMNQYSSAFPQGIAVERFGLVIEAGDLGGTLMKALDGNILRSFIDLSGSPESAFIVTAIDTFLASTPIAAQSQPGAQNAEDLIQSVCAAAGLGFDNSASAHAVLRNQATYGSGIDQIARIATAAGFDWKRERNTVSIWPKGATVDETIIDIGPATDPPMIGYPSYWEGGLIVRSLYNPQVRIGRRMNVESTIPKARGLWAITFVQHDLTSMFPKGPWFTTAQLTPIGNV